MKEFYMRQGQVQGQILSTLSSIEKSLDELRRDVKDDLLAVTKKYDLEIETLKNRITKLETKHNKIDGGLLVIGMVAGVLGSVLTILAGPILRRFF